MNWRLGLLFLFLSALYLGNTDASPRISEHAAAGLSVQLRNSTQVSTQVLHPATETYLITEEEDTPENSFSKRSDCAAADKPLTHHFGAAIADRSLSHSNAPAPSGAYDTKRYLVFRVFLI